MIPVNERILFDDQEQSECKFLVMSEAGKPVFSSHGSDQEVARICGLLQAIQSSITYSQETDLGGIRSLRSDSLFLVFMSVASITLVAMSPVTSNGESETEAYLRLQLEYIYAQIIMSLTEQVQSAFRQNAGLDIRSELHRSAFQRILYEAGPKGNPSPFLAGGVQTVFPLSPEIREEASKALLSVEHEDTVFAIIFIGSKIVTLVQPPFRPHQIKVSDLHLVLGCLDRQPGLLSSELWLPICLPRFNSSGFLYCYTNCLDHSTKLMLALVSQHGTTEQFQEFRKAASIVRCKLGLRNANETVLKILDTETSFESSRISGSLDVNWKRGGSVEVEENDEDYVDVDVSGDASRMIPYEPGASIGDNLIRELKNIEQADSTLQTYLEIADAMHFVFRLELPIIVTCRRKNRGNAGHLAQCISSPLGFPFVDVASKRRVWNIYQKLNLRLRLGSASTESTMDAFDMITKDCVNNDDVAHGVAQYCPATGLVESPPNIQGITYVVDGKETFLAMNGRSFELYVVVSSTIPVKQAVALAARLARRLITDQRILFLSTPFAWKE